MTPLDGGFHLDGVFFITLWPVYQIHIDFFYYKNHTSCNQWKHLKEYYEIVGESRPLSAFSPKHADFVTEMHF